MITAVLIETAAVILFYLVLLVAIAVPLFLLFFAALSVRAAWRWLMRGVWGDVIVQVERKALRGR
jgi:hypothetical protein